jgi:hypothetical protein
MTVRRAVLLVGVLPLFALAGCGQSQTGTGVATANDGTAAAQSAGPSPTVSSDPLKFAQCMRENGIQMDDPDGSGQIRIMAKNEDKEKMEKAQKECGKYLQGGKLGNAANDPKVQDAMVKFAECMRKNGVDMPDPEANGGGVKITRPRGGDSEAFEKARKACEEFLPGRPGTP